MEKKTPVDLSKMAIVVDRNGHLQAQYPRKDSWTVEEQGVFLDWLAATCNVRQSCAAIGRQGTSAYFRRRTDVEFARLWDDALETGRAALHTMLLARARGMGGGNSEDVDDPEKIDTDLALKLLGQYDRDKSHRRKGGIKRNRPTREETDIAILKKLKALGVRIQGEEGQCPHNNG